MTRYCFRQIWKFSLVEEASVSVGMDERESFWMPKKTNLMIVEVGNSPCKKVVFDEKSLHLLKTFFERGIRIIVCDTFT